MILFIICFVVALALPALRPAPGRRGAPDGVRRLRMASRLPRTGSPAAPPASASRTCSSSAGVRGRCSRWRRSSSSRSPTSSSVASAPPASSPSTRSDLPDPLGPSQLHGRAHRRRAFWRQIVNSLIIAAIATVARRRRRALAAFAFARIQFRGREAIYTFFTLGLLFPSRSRSCRSTSCVRQLGLARQPCSASPCRRRPSGCRSRSSSCARSCGPSRSSSRTRRAIDGCSAFGFFWRILLPLSRPALVTVSILAIVGSWNAFLLPLLVLSDPTSGRCRSGS